MHCQGKLPRLEIFLDELEKEKKKEKDKDLLTRIREIKIQRSKSRSENPSRLQKSAEKRRKLPKPHTKISFFLEKERLMMLKEAKQELWRR